MQAARTDSAIHPPRSASPGKRVGAESVGAGRLRTSGWMWALAGALFVVYAALSLRIHQRILSNSYDLGIFEQVVRSYAHGQLPVSELKAPDFPVLGDHFSPVLALLAPFYRLWPTARTLLVAQAALIAVSVLPLTAWARRALGSQAAVAVGLCYGLSWGIASAVGFDFHEVAFAVPLLACSLAALGEGRARAAAGWALPLLVVKEDLGLTVLAIGLVIAGRGERRLGLATAAAGLAGSLLAILVALPAFNPGGSFAYWSFLETPGGGGGGAAQLLYRSTIGLVTPEAKATTLLLVLAPTLFLALRSPLLWIALPTLLWRFASNDSVHWGTGYHYSLVLMPIVFAAFVDALATREPTARSLRRHLLGSAAVTLLLLPQYPLWQLVQSATWRTDPRVAEAHRLMDRIPDNATVQASTLLVPQLTNRTSVSLYGWAQSRPDPAWIMVDTWTPYYKRWPLTVDQERAALAWNVEHGYRAVATQDGFVLLNRTAKSGT